MSVAALVTLAATARWAWNREAGARAAIPSAPAGLAETVDRATQRVAVDAPPLDLPMRATTPAEVRDVVRFCRNATEVDRETLRFAAVRSADPLVAGNAIRALGRMGHVAGDPALVALLDDERTRVRQEVAFALGRSGDTTAVEPLRRHSDDPDPLVRPLIAQALRRLESQ